MDNTELINLLRRVFKAGLNRVPKKQKDADALMALSLLALDVDGIFNEAEMDNHLTAWLAGVSSGNSSVDHVTWRRALVDHGFLRRATDGAIYRIRGEAIDQALSTEAKAVDPSVVYTEASLSKQKRQARFAQRDL